MKHYLSLFIATSLLTCCTPATPELPTIDTVGYSLQINHENKKELIAMSQRVVTGRLQALTQGTVPVSIDQTQAVPILTMQTTPQAFTRLTQQLNGPLHLHVMIETDIDSADIIIADIKGFKTTSIDETDIIWLTTEEESTQPIISIELTPQGTQELKTLFAENPEADVRLFIRQNPITTLDSTQLLENNRLILRDIDSKEIAAIFVDDVNVSMHVQFVPLPSSS